MRFFRRRRADDAAGVPPRRGACACPEHVEDLTGLVVPFAPWVGMEDAEPMTVGDLVEAGALGVSPDQLVWADDVESGGRIGPLHWELWVGDEARMSYDDAAPLGMDESLLRQPGIEAVVWEDREVFHVSSPTLCADGVLAAAARALLDPRVRP